MDKVQLENFTLLAQTLNFSTVAKQKFISQPALTKQISRLEEELGVRLFDRSKHGVSLTYAGEEFFRHAREILDGIEKAQRHMEFIQMGQTGSLDISSVFGLDDAISRCVGAFVRRYPNVNVDISTGTGSQQVERINRQQADVFFSYSPLLDLFPSIEYINLPDDRFSIYACREDIDRIRREGLGYLNRLTHLVEYRSEGGPLFTGMIHAIREALGITAENISYYSSNSTVMIAVQAGIGFAFLPERMYFGVTPDNVGKLPLEVPEAVIRRAVGWFRNSKNVSAAQFMELVRESAAQQTEANSFIQ